MRKYLNLLTPTDEFIVVIVAALGATFVANVLYVFFPLPSQTAISEDALHELLVIEPIILVLVGWFLYARGWTLDTIGLLPSLKDTIFGVGLAFVIEFGSIAVWLVWTQLGLPSPTTSGAIAGPFNPITIIAVSVLNPIFEEIVLSGYVITALKRRTTWQIAATASVALRALCHIYQGSAIVYMLVFGIVLAWWYARYGRLWPLIIAHVVFDFFPLLAYQG